MPQEKQKKNIYQPLPFHLASRNSPYGQYNSGRRISPVGVCTLALASCNTGDYIYQFRGRYWGSPELRLPTATISQQNPKICTPQPSKSPKTIEAQTSRPCSGRHMENLHSGRCSSITDLRTHRWNDFAANPSNVRGVRDLFHHFLFFFQLRSRSVSSISWHGVGEAFT